MNVKTIDYNSQTAKKDFFTSLHETGFAVIENHPIPKEDLNAIYSSWKKFFNSDQKNLWLRDPIKQDGYFPFKSENAKGSYGAGLCTDAQDLPWQPPHL